ncbi:MAG: carbohydrate ABC transporter substrate-binding protein, partial [Treponema sp.]|nr:carbohydrate ABC transporter substrate-binding protein [Treponema sp.]
MRKTLHFAGLLCLPFLFALLSCGVKDAFASKDSMEAYETKYSDIILGETATDLDSSILLISHRTDMATPEYNGVSWMDYIKEFNRVYPKIKVSVEALTEYSENASNMLERGGWGDIMMIPISDKSQYSKYFIPFGTEGELSRSLRFADQFSYGGRVYGIASAGNVQGIVYNKKVFREAGIKTLPKTPDEFLDDLRLIKKNTKAIPLYTNYAAVWPLNQWDYYITSTATGDAGYLNHTMLHKKNPFSDPGDGSGAYNVYRILYQAVEEGLIEDDFTATDWEGC